MSALDQYRQAKNSIAQLEAAAKKEIVQEFNGTLTRLFVLQKEAASFGIKLAIPKKAPAIRRRKVNVSPPPPPIVKSVSDSRTIKDLERKLMTQRKRLESDQARGKNVKAVQDHIYELEDELRLEREKAL